jgi:N-methylhydantoinase A
MDGARELESDGAEVVASRQQHHADLCYEGQLHTLTVGFDPDLENVVTELVGAFTAQYVAEFGTTLERAIRVVNVRTSTFGQRPEVPWRAAIEKTERGLPDGRRDVYLDGAWTSVPLYDRAALTAGAEIDGPCVLEQTDCTTFLEVGTNGRVDEHLNLILEVGS